MVFLFCWFQCSSHSARFHWGLEFTKRRVLKCATESKADTGLQQPTVRIWKSLWFGEDFHLHKNGSVIKKSILFWGKKAIKATLEETTALRTFHRTRVSSFIYLCISMSLYMACENKFRCLVTSHMGILCSISTKLQLLYLWKYLQSNPTLDFCCPWDKE